jgi:hypothetical protein
VMYGGAIAGCSKLQPTVATSTADAKCMAAAHAEGHALWLCKHLKDQGMKVEMINIKIDNRTALLMIEKGVESVKTKHTDVHNHFICEQSEGNDLHFEACHAGS